MRDDKIVSTSRIKKKKSFSTHENIKLKDLAAAQTNDHLKYLLLDFRHKVEYNPNLKPK